MKQIYRTEAPPSGSLGQVYLQVKKNYILPVILVAVFLLFGWKIVTTYLGGGYFVDIHTDRAISPIYMFFIAIGAGVGAVALFIIAFRQKTLAICEYGIAVKDQHYPYADLVQIETNIMSAAPTVILFQRNGEKVVIMVMVLTKKTRQMLEEASAAVRHSAATQDSVRSDL